MKQHYENVIKTLKEMTEGNKTIPNDESLDESLRLSLLDIYSSKEHKKLGNLVSLLTNVYLKNGEFKEIRVELKVDEKDIKKAIEPFFRGINNPAETLFRISQ